MRVIQDRVDQVMNAKTMTEKEDQDTRSFLLDVFATLSAFLTIYPEGSQAFVQKHDLLAKIPFIYDEVSKDNIMEKEKDGYTDGEERKKLKMIAIGNHFQFFSLFSICISFTLH